MWDEKRGTLLSIITSGVPLTGYFNHEDYRYVQIWPSSRFVLD